MVLGGFGVGRDIGGMGRANRTQWGGVSGGTVTERASEEAVNERFRESLEGFKKVGRT